MSFLIALLAGAAAGILSGFGIGGGTLLMLYMTGFAKIPQLMAQGVNLLYFLPTSAAALFSHVKQGYVRWRAAVPAIAAGAVCTLAASFAATAMDVSIMKKLFGLFLIYVGLSELFKKQKKGKR